MGALDGKALVEGRNDKEPSELAGRANGAP